MAKYQFYPDADDRDFGARLHAKLEMVPVPTSEVCPGSPGQGDGRAKFDLHPVQQFVTAFLSPMTPYRSLLLFHGTGVGKTCTAANVAESFAGTGRQPLLVVPHTIAGHFRTTMYDVRKIPADDDGNLDLAASARAQCTGSKHVLDDSVSKRDDLTRGMLWTSMQQKLGRRFRMIGHEELGNKIEAIVDSVKSDFADVTESMREKELTSVIRRIYEGRLIVVDEAHDMTPKGTNKHRGGYDAIMEVLKRCSDVRLLLMTATPMFDRASEIVPLMNLLLANEGKPLLAASDVFDNVGSISEELSERGAALLRAAAVGRVSFATGDDPRSFPVSLSAKLAGVAGAGLARPPSVEYSGKPIPSKESWSSVGSDFTGTVDDPDRIVVATLSELQERVLLAALSEGGTGGEGEAEGEDVAVGKGDGTLRGKGLRGPRGPRGPPPAPLTDSTIRQVCNVTFDPELGDHTGQGQFRSAFQVMMSNSSGLQVSPKSGPRGNPLSEKEIGSVAPKFKNIVDSVVAASSRGHLSFVFSSYVWAGVIPLAVALELRGILPAKGRPILSPAPANVKRLGKYVIISKHPALDPTWSVTDKVSATNSPGSGITVVLGTEMASQGLDFAAVRQIHVVEPWYNSSRTHQVVGRGVRRCSHSRLPPSDRNVTVHYHAAKFSPRAKSAFGGLERETVDIKSLRFSRLKRKTVEKVERLLRNSALDCDLYHRFADRHPAANGDSGGSAWARIVVASNGARIKPESIKGFAWKVSTCAMPWNVPDDKRVDRSTFHPHSWNHRTDMTAWDVTDLLKRNRAMTYSEIMESIGSEQTDLSLSLALDMLLDPLRSSKYLFPDKMLFVSGTYALFPVDMGDGKITLREARERRVFGATRDRVGLRNPVETTEKIAKKGGSDQSGYLVT